MYTNEVLKKAKYLEARKDTEWAERNEAKYEAFAEEIEKLWAEDKLTDKEFNDLALMAFWDYPNLKYDEEQDTLNGEYEAYLRCVSPFYDDPMNEPFWMR